MEDDNLVEILNTIGNKSKILKDAPITMSLAKKNVSALIVQDNEKLVEKFMQSILMQLITFHSYEDLKLVFLVKEDIQKKWEHMKMLPHIWNNTKQIRFFADDYNDMQEISKYLEEELVNRLNIDEEIDYKSFSPYYLIITDDYKKIENCRALRIMVEVVAALVWDKNKFLICQRPEGKARGLLWEFVGGKVEKGETKEQALIRECREELEIVIAVGDVFMDVIHNYPDIDVHLTLFNAKITEGTPVMLEHNDIKWIGVEEIPAYSFCPADEQILEAIKRKVK